MWKGHFLQSFTVKFGGGCDLVFSVKETMGVVTTYLSTRDVGFHKKQLDVQLKQTMLGSYMYVVHIYIATILIGQAKKGFIYIASPRMSKECL